MMRRLIGALVAAVIVLVMAAVFAKGDTPVKIGSSDYGRIEYYQAGDKYLAAVGSLYRYTRDGRPIDTNWYYENGVYRAGNNTFQAVVNKYGVVVQAGDYQLTYSPEVSVGKVKYPLTDISLVDPGVLSLDYSGNIRYLHLINGRLVGYWYFDSPAGECRVDYHQAGNIRLNLGAYAAGDDAEIIPAADVLDLAAAGAPVVIGDTIEFTPDGDPETSSVDGYVQRDNNEAWAVGHAAASGTAANDSGTAASTWIRGWDSGGVKWSPINRIIMVFDKSDLPLGTEITAVTLSVYGYSKLSEFGPWSPALTVCGHDTTNETSLVVGDYNIAKFGDEYAASRITYADYNTAGYNDLEFNQDGIDYVSANDIVKFGVLEANYDYDNVEPANPGYPSKSITFALRLSEYGLGYQPTLVIEYVPPEPPAAPVNLSWVETGVASGNITWTDADYCLGTKIYLAYSAAGPFYEVYDGLGEIYSASGLDLNSTVYYCYAQSYNGYGQSDLTETMQFGGDDMEVSLSLPAGFYALMVAFGLVFISFFIKTPLIYLAIIPCMFGVILEPEFNDKWLQAGCVLVMIWAGLAFFKRISQGGEG